MCFDTGAIPPERFWLDGAEVVPERTRLSQGLHTLLIKYPHGLRTRFVVLRADAPNSGNKCRWPCNGMRIPM